MKLILIIIFSISYAYSCTPIIGPTPECIGKDKNYIRRFKVIKSDLPAHFITTSDSSITIKVPAKEFVYCLRKAKEKQMWDEEYRVKKSEFLKTCKITQFAACRQKETDKKKKVEADFWDCTVKSGFCGGYEVPPTYEILGLWDLRQEEAAIVAINSGKVNFVGEETQYFLYQGKVKFLTFSVEWMKNPNFKKECVD